MDFKAAIFDLDGTVLNSMDVWEKIDIDFLAKRNLNVPDGYINEICSRSFLEAANYTINLFNLNEKADDIINEWNDMAIHEYSNNVKLKPYAKEYIIYLKEIGIKLSVATGLPTALFEPALKNNGIYDLFDAICSTDEVERGKEYPDIFLLCAKRMKVNPRDCIVFEDVLPAIISSKRAGMKVFGVHDKYSEMYKIDIKKIANGYLYNFKNAPHPKNK
ncbi:HAD family phosphatase [Clostridium sp. CTA-19]